MERKCLPTFADLIDELTINQIKQIYLPDNKESYIARAQLLLDDINLLIKEKQVSLSAHFILAIIILAQVNLHIWNNKAEMVIDGEQYISLLKLSHQLNGIRNQVKNHLLITTKEMDAAIQKSNFRTDGLSIWDISLLQGDN